MCTSFCFIRVISARFVRSPSRFVSGARPRWLNTNWPHKINRGFKMLIWLDVRTDVMQTGAYSLASDGYSWRKNYWMHLPDLCRDTSSSGIEFWALYTDHCCRSCELRQRLLRLNCIELDVEELEWSSLSLSLTLLKWSARNVSNRGCNSDICMNAVFNTINLSKLDGGLG